MRRERADEADSVAVRAEKITKAFGGRQVLDSVDLCVGAAEAICVTGCNAAGKSTLLRIISGLLKADSGRVIAGSCEIGDVDWQRQIGIILHEPMVYPELTVLENIRFWAQLYSVKDFAGRCERLLGEMGLGAYRHDEARILSRGMTQRLAIVRALIHSPDILLGDEPFSGLDADSTNRIIEMFRRFKSEGGSIVLTSHMVEPALRCCDRFAVLDGHRIIFDRPTGEMDTERFRRDYLEYAREQIR